MTFYPPSSQLVVLIQLKFEATYNFSPSEIFQLRKETLLLSSLWFSFGRKAGQIGHEVCQKKQKLVEA